MTPYSHPVQSLYHAQDAYGQYIYGYATPTSSKTETKTADGVTRGGYSYIDSNGILQSVEYIADHVHGFRVAATNLPQDLPDVAYAKAQHLAQYEATKAENAVAAYKAVHYSNPIAVPYESVPQVALLPPSSVRDLPEVIQARVEHLAAIEAIKIRDAAIAAEHAAIAARNAAHISPIPATGYVVPVKAAAAFATVTHVPYAHGAETTQYHAQDVHGQYSYGYAGPLSAKSETKTADGITRGGYSYIDANGVLQTVHYVSDPVNGFRVAATNLPVDHGHVAAHSASHAPVVAAKSSGLYAHDIYY